MKHDSNYWNDKNNVFNESKKYTSRTSFNRRSHQAYETARKNKWLDEMYWLNVKNKNIFTDEADYVYKYYFAEENAVYVGRTINTRIRDLQHRTRENDSVYKFAKKHNVEIPKMEIIESGITVNQGVEKEIYWERYFKENGFLIINKTKCGSVGNVGKSRWTKKKCIEEAKKYKTLSDFMKYSNTAYQRSLKKEWILEMTWLERYKRNKPKKEKEKKSTIKTLPKGYWKDKENMMEEARKYSTKEEFQKGNLTAFLAAYRYGFIEEMDWLVKQKQHKKNYWTYKHIEEEAIKYKTKTEFFQKNQTAYRAALKMGIIDDFFIDNYIEY